MTGTVTFEKLQRTGEDEVRRYSQLPEVRRLKFHSYIVTAEKDGSTLVFFDPLREKGYVYYPPGFRRVAVPLKDTA
jgi:inner membrane protein